MAAFVVLVGCGPSSHSGLSDAGVEHPAADASGSSDAGSAVADAGGSSDAGSTVADAGDAPDAGGSPGATCAEDNGGCSPDARCAVEAEQVVCVCNPGFAGDGKRCADVDECATNNGGCDAHAACTNTVGSRSCTCRPGYSGDGVTCADVDECLTDHGGCDANATCTNTPGSHSCTCNAGFSGDGVTCTDIDECATNNGGCDAHAVCTNVPGSRACTCAAGFSGDGRICSDVNECATNNGGCDQNATCTNTVGSRTCACNDGFTGNGLTCSDVNECLANNGGCDQNATCTNTAGSRTCACNPGFTGDGKSCVDVDECATNNGGCDQNATCTNTPGSRTCACKQGYSGDGFTCAFVIPPGTNPIQAENMQAGSPDWPIRSPIDYRRQVEGYADRTSYATGDTVKLFLSSGVSAPTDTSATLEFYRLGWYGGAGARKVRGPIAVPITNEPQPQPDQFNMNECNWSVRHSFVVPSTWVSGLYLVKLTGATSGRQSWITFVVRDDARNAPLLHVVPVTTWQAYNPWGPLTRSFYTGGVSPNGVSGDQGGMIAGQLRAVKVSFNRPYGGQPGAFGGPGYGAGRLLANLIAPSQYIGNDGDTYLFVRFFEKEGYDVSYTTDVDLHANAASITRAHHAGLVLEGHYEYWSKEARDNLEAAIVSGTSTAFFTGNTSYWQVRYEPSPLTGEANRTVVGYKENCGLATVNNGAPGPDPMYPGPTSTCRWSSSVVNRPISQLLGENELAANPVLSGAIAYTPAHWMLARTNLGAGAVIPYALGAEVGGVLTQPTGSQCLLPSGPGGCTDLTKIFSSPFGASGTPSRASSISGTSDIVAYRAKSGADVVAFGSFIWGSLLDAYSVTNDPTCGSDSFAYAKVTIAGGSGTVGVTVNGAQVTTAAAGSDAGTASALAAAINADSAASALVSASASGSVVTLTARVAGAAGNYPLAVSGSGVTSAAIAGMTPNALREGVITQHCHAPVSAAAQQITRNVLDRLITHP